MVCWLKAAGSVPVTKTGFPSVRTTTPPRVVAIEIISRSKVMRYCIGQACGKYLSDTHRRLPVNPTSTLLANGIKPCRGPVGYREELSSGGPIHVELGKTSARVTAMLVSMKDSPCKLKCGIR